MRNAPTLDAEIKYLEEILDSSAQDPYLLFKLANGYLKSKKYELALTNYKRIVNQSHSFSSKILLFFEQTIFYDIRNADLRLCFIEFLLFEGAVNEVLAEIPEILEISPKHEKIYKILEEISLKEDNLDELIILLENFGKNIFVSPAALLLANCYLKKKLVNEAVLIYEELERNEPNNLKFLKVLADLYAKESSFEKASQRYHQIVDFDSSTVGEVGQKMEGLLRREPENNSILRVLSEIYLKWLKPESAVSCYQKMLRIDKGTTNECTEALKKLLESYPVLVEAVLLLADIYVSTKRFSEAISLFAKLLEDRPVASAEIIEKLKEIIKIEPKQVFAYQILGDAYFKMDNFSPALEAYQKVIEISPVEISEIISKCEKIKEKGINYPLLYFVLGKAYLQKGDVAAGLSEGEALIKNFKSLPFGYEILAQGYLKTQNYQKAQNYIKSALLIDPYNFFLYQKCQQIEEQILDHEILSSTASLEKDLKGKINLKLGELYLKRGQFQEANVSFQNALKLGGNPICYKFLGVSFKQEGEFELALYNFQHYLEAVSAKNEKEKKETLYFLGQVYEILGEIDKAFDLYEQVLAVDLSFQNLQRKILVLKSCSLEAVKNKCLTAVIDRDNIFGCWGKSKKPDKGNKRKEEPTLSFAQVHNNSGFSYFQKSQFTAAAEEFSLANQLDPTLWSSYNNLALTAMAGKNYSEARHYIKEALRLNPTSLVVRHNLGIFYLIQKDFDQARLEFESVLKEDPYSFSNINLGDIYYQEKEVEKSFVCWERAKQFTPLSELCSRRLQYKVL
jgi:tetratricopeptide (TPR) repeat protein